MGFLFYLSAAQLVAIEALRNGDDLKLAIWLSGEINYKGKSSTFMDRGDFVIPKQEWLKALELMNYRDTLLFELPMPNNSTDKNLKHLLERAQTHILNGHYQESVGLCRQALELIESKRDDKKAASNAVSKYKNNRLEMNVNERLLFLREGLKNITHLGSHNADEFSRNQAQAILGMTVTLLSNPEVGILS